MAEFAAFNNQLQNGTTLQSWTIQYKVEELIGSGHFGNVFKCSKNTKKVAIKVSMNNGEHLATSNLKEIKILKILKRKKAFEHNIVRFHENFYFMDNTCLVFELLGRNLADYVNEFPLTLNHIRPIMEQILSALLKLKELCLIHADLKPQNIVLVETSNLVRQTWRVKLVDFGLSLFNNEASTRRYLQTRFYRAPEMFLGLPFNEAIDMWSLGCIAAELVLQRPLYPGGTSFLQMSYICQTQGLPPDWMLNSGIRTRLYFVLDQYGWRFWTPEEIGQPVFQNPSFTHRGLDRIVDVNVIPINHEIEYHQVVMQDREEFLNLLKRMLTLDPMSRISPEEGLQHPFVTLTHLATKASFDPYVKEGKKVTKYLRRYKKSAKRNFRRRI